MLIARSYLPVAKGYPRVSEHVFFDWDSIVVLWGPAPTGTMTIEMYPYSQIISRVMACL